MIITTKEIVGWVPCGRYDMDVVRGLVGDGLTPREVGELNIPANDRFWVLSRYIYSDKPDWFDWSSFWTLACMFTLGSPNRWEILILNILTYIENGLDLRPLNRE